jgi:hypothetical protein
MWITQQITARIFVWLAAVVIPFQGVPSTTCGCTTAGVRSHETNVTQSCCDSSLATPGKTSASCCSQKRIGRCCCTGAKVCRCGEGSPCRRQSRACCSVQATNGSCCSGSDSVARQKAGCQCGADCPCGANCQCGKPNAPSEPAAPPVENSSPERIVASSAAVASLATVCQPSTTRQHLDRCAKADALAAVDRCITLCRFTI